MTSSPPLSRAATDDARSDAGAAFARLVRWGAGVRFAELPDDVVRRALLVLADDLGAMIAVRDDHQVAAVRTSLLDAAAGGPAEATVFAAGRLRGERAAVATANGTAAGWGEMDEGYRPATCHGGLYVLPALLAEIEARGRTVQELLAGLVAGYEVVTRVARTWAQDDLVIHPHALYSPIGAAAGAAFGAGADAETALAAVCAAATTLMLGAFDHATSGALARNTWTGIAAWMGIQHTRWAAAGIGGTSTAPWTALHAGLGAPTDLARLDEGLGETWAIRDGYHKLFACCQYTHSTVEALLGVREEIGAARVDEIVSVDVATHPLALKLDDASPTTSLGAKFSVPHTAAAALVRGGIDADACAPAAIADPRIAELRGRVRMSAFPDLPAAPHDRPATVTVRLGDGTEVTRTCLSAIGAPDRPLALDVLLDDKLAAATEAAHPDFVAGIRRLLTEPERLRRRWDETLDDLLED